MQGIRTKGTRLAFGLAVALAAFVALTATALAETSHATAQLTSGSLCISTPLHAGSFAGDLDGRSNEIDGVGFGGFVVEDQRGTGVGWQVTMVASQFSNDSIPGKGMALGSLRMPVLTVSKTDSSSSAVPGLLNQAAAIDTGGVGVVVASCAAAGQGMGSYQFETGNGSRWKLAITSDEYAGDYKSTITTTLASLAL
jgi:hypothetical protein